MALTRFALKLIAPHLRDSSVLCFGYPDLLVTPAQVKEDHGIEVTKTTTFGSGHKMRVGLAETEEVFRALGVRSLMCLDIAPSRGVEQVVDLNEPLEMELHDVVIDAGTIEHCANIGQALRNAKEAVAREGIVFHSPPLSMVNHGFYNVCPTLLHDYYTQNGFEVLHHSAFTKGDFKGFDVQPTARFKSPAEAALYFVAKRVSFVAPHRWPKQTKYMNAAGT